MGNKIYDSLTENQIRVLTLHPARESSQAIHCTLRTVSLSDPNLKFVALSWTWGPAEWFPGKIFVNNRQLKVRRNLIDALHALRIQAHGQPQDLWIDALSINQQDENEKVQQIPIMDQIYHRASYVVVWLGKAGDDSEYIMNCIRQDRQQAFREGRFVVGKTKLMNRPWWTRTWVMQEFMLNPVPPQIACGPGERISWTIFASAIQQGNLALAQTGVFDGPSGVPMAKRVNQVAQTALPVLITALVSFLRDPNYTANLTSALSSTQITQATDPRDKVWGCWVC